MDFELPEERVHVQNSPTISPRKKRAEAPRNMTEIVIRADGV